jgi:membrane protease YdiL (CAAX protease family)
MTTPPPAPRAPSPPRGAAARRLALGALAVLATVLLAALVAGPLHRALAAAGWRREDEVASTLRRVLVVALVVLLVLATRPWRDAPRDVWGLRGPAARPALFPVGVALALALTGALVLVHAAFGWLSWERRAAEKLASRWPGALATALAVGFLEEVFFRGWLLSRFLVRGGALPAALATSLLYALPHGFKGSAAPRGLPPDLSGALEALGAWASSMGDLAAFGPKVVGFASFGMLLAAARLRTGGLWLGIGLHAGAVFALEAYGALTHRVPDRNWAGTKFLHDGLPAWLLLAAVTFALWPRPARRG